MIENYRSGFIWELMRRCPSIYSGHAARRLHRRVAIAMAVTGPKSTKPADHEEDLLRRVRPVDWINPVPKPLDDLVIVGGGLPPGWQQPNGRYASGFGWRSSNGTG